LKWFFIAEYGDIDWTVAVSRRDHLSADIVTVNWRYQARGLGPLLSVL
jgi:hypothetical protein